MSAQTVANLQLAVGLLIPLAVGVITKSSASGGLKSTLLVVLNAANVGVTRWLGDLSLDLNLLFSQFVQTTVVAVATYYGVWKPTGVAGTVAAKTAGFGIGSPPDLETADKGAEDTPPPATPPAKKAAAKKAAR